MPGYASVNGLAVYHVVHGHGPPLILLHGALGTIEPACSWRRRWKAYPSSTSITHMMPYAYDSVRMLVNGFESGPQTVERDSRGAA
jgi:hypothetical protein